MDFLQKTHSKGSDQLQISKDQFDPKNIPKSFTIGVYAKQHSKFSLLYQPDFANIIHIHYQKLTEMTLKKGQIYYFDFYHKNEVFNSMLYATGSDVEVGVLEYNKNKGQNFLDQVTDQKNYVQKFIYKNGDVPRKRQAKASVDRNSHYVISIKPLDAQALVYFTIYN